MSALLRVHGREHVVLLRPLDGGLVMQQLHFAAEVRQMKYLGVEEAPLKDAELKLAQQLIEQQASDTFDPSGFVDEVKQRVEAAIERKVEGKELFISEPPAAERSDNIIDLMDALRASLNGKAKPSVTPTITKEDRKPARRVAGRSGTAHRKTSRTQRS